MSTTAFLTDFDLHLIGEGSHERAYEKMGAHLTNIDGQPGVHFAVWAPSARQVYLMGDFNGWHGESHLMQANPGGIWSLFVPGLVEYAVYENDFDRAGFTWIDAGDRENSILAFIRIATSSAELIVVISNFTPTPHFDYRIGVPWPGDYLNSDSASYGGSNIGNEGSLTTEAIPMHGQPQSLRLILPPLATIMLK